MNETPVLGFAKIKIIIKNGYYCIIKTEIRDKSIPKIKSTPF